MTNAEIIHELWALHHLHNLVGFPNHQLFVVQVDGAANGANFPTPPVGIMAKGLNPGSGEEIQHVVFIDVPEDGDFKAFGAQWLAFVGALQSKPEDELKAIYDKSLACANTMEICISLINKGFMLRAPAGHN